MYIQKMLIKRQKSFKIKHDLVIQIIYFKIKLGNLIHLLKMVTIDLPIQDRHRTGTRYILIQLHCIKMMSGFSKNIPGYPWWDYTGSAILIKKMSTQVFLLFVSLQLSICPSLGHLLLFYITSSAIYEQRLFNCSLNSSISHSFIIFFIW